MPAPAHLPPGLNQAIHIFFWLAVFLTFLSVYRHLRFRSRIAYRGAAFGIVLGLELFFFTAAWTDIPGSHRVYWYYLQVLAFYPLPLLWFYFIDGFSDRARQSHGRLIFIILCGLIPVFAVAFFDKALAAIDAAIQSGRASSVFIVAEGSGIWSALLLIYQLLILLLAFFHVARLYLRRRYPSDRVLYPPMLAGMLALVAAMALEWSGVFFAGSVSLVQFCLAALGLTIFFYTTLYKFSGILPINKASVFPIMRDGSILLDADSRVIDVNPPAEKALKCSKRDWVNRPVSEVWPEVASLIDAQPEENHLAKEIVYQDGLDAFRTQISVTRFAGINNTTTGWLITIRNITERDQLETTLIERNMLMARSTALMQELAEVNLVIQASNDLAAIFPVMQAHFEKINLGYAIATLDAQSGELTVEFLSIAPDLLKRIEKVARISATGQRLSRAAFPELYSFLDDTRRDALTQTPTGEDLAIRHLFQPETAVALQRLGFDLAVPICLFRMTAGADLVGLMGVWGSGLHMDNINPLRIFAGQIAWAIERVRLFELEQQRALELERSNRLFAALANVSAQMSGSTDSYTLLHILGSQLEEIGLHCALAALAPDGENIIVQYGSFQANPHGLLPEISIKGYQFPLRSWPAAPGFQQGAPSWYHDIFSIFKTVFPQAPDMVIKRLLKQNGMTGGDHLCILPLMVDGRVEYALAIWGNSIYEKDTAALMVFANQVAGSLHKTQGYEAQSARAQTLERSNDMMITLSNVAAQFKTTTDSSELFEILGRELRKMNLSCMVAMLINEDQFLKIEHLSILPQLLTWIQSLGSFMPDGMIVPRFLWPSDIGITEKAPFWDENPAVSVSRMFPFVPQFIFSRVFEKTGENGRNQMCTLPIIVENDVIGILTIWGPGLVRDDIPGLSAFTSQLAAAIKNSTLYSQAQVEIRTRRQAEAAIQAALDEKEVLLKEIHHRVKNNLQVISSLLSLQMTESKDAACAEGLRESQNRVRAMALIHEKLYQSDDMARVNFSSYLTSLISSLAQTYRTAQDKASIKAEIGDILLDLDTAIPCGLIINELVSNSLKYAFPDRTAGSIIVSCGVDGDGSCVLVVADDGVGLPEGIDPEKTNSLGLKLVTSLVRQIDGEMTIAARDGLRFEIRFPLPKT